MNYRVLGLLFSEKCNIRCEHCCTESSPTALATMELKSVYALLDQAKAVGQFHQIAVTGGEPLLFLDELVQIGSYAASLGFTLSVTTNSFWATSSRRAYDIIARLREAGLDCLNLSISQFHLAFIPVDRVRTALDAALRQDVKVRVNYIATRTYQRSQVEAIFRDVLNRIDIVEMKCLPVGRAGVEVPLAELLHKDGIPFGSCASYFTRLPVLPNGDVYPCCSPGGFTSPLKIGNINSMSLTDILNAAAQSKLLMILDLFGPAFFVPFIEDVLGPGALSRFSFVDQCHLCHTMMSDEQCRSVVLSLCERLDLTRLLEDGALVQSRRDLLFGKEVRENG